jgi:hypothetical protein
MALVNALQNQPAEPFHPHLRESASRIMKIRSIWPFPVKGNPATESGDCEPAPDEAGDSVAPSSFVT